MSNTKTIFTMAEVATICKVAPSTVAKWFDSGRLRGYRIPGSQDRRIPKEYLISFLKEYGFPAQMVEDVGASDNCTPQQALSSTHCRLREIFKEAELTDELIDRIMGVILMNEGAIGRADYQKGYNDGLFDAQQMSDKVDV